MLDGCLHGPQSFSKACYFKISKKYGIPGALLSSVQDWHAGFSLFLCGPLSDSQGNSRCEWIPVEPLACAMKFLMGMTILVTKNIVYHFRLTY